MQGRRLWYLLAAIACSLILASFFSWTPEPSTTRPAPYSVNLSPPAMSERSPDAEAERVHNKKVLETIRQKRFDIVTPGLPLWVKNRFVAFESLLDEQDATDSKSVAWGVGWYEGRAFTWFAYITNEGELQMDLSIPLNQKDIDAINRVGSGLRAVDSTFKENGRDWSGEFCVRPNSTVCDVAGAFEEHLLGPANSLQIQIVFMLRGQFP